MPFLAAYGTLSWPDSGMVYRVAVGLVFDPLLHLGVVGLAGPLPLVGGLRGTPRLISSEPNVTGVDGGGIMRISALSVWLRGDSTDLLRPLGPLPALVTPGSNDTACIGLL